MKKKIIIVLSTIIITVIIAVATVSAVELYKEENTTFLASNSKSEAEKKEIKDVDPDSWFQEYYLTLKTKYAKTGDETVDKNVDLMNEKIDAFYEKIKHGITQDEYNVLEKEIYSIATNIDLIQGVKNEKTDIEQNDYSRADSKISEIRSELDQYIVEYEFIKDNEKGGNSSRTRAKLKNAYEFDEELKNAEEKLKNRDLTVEEANELVDDLYKKYLEVNSYVGNE